MRILTVDEIKLLSPVFKNALNYHWIQCTINTLDMGGEYNSITPAGVIYFSRHIYCDDFSKNQDIDQQWTFVHEVMHAWQWQHGTYAVYKAIGLAFKFGTKYDPDAYPYDLTQEKKLTDYNIEQQASIIADYWWLDTQKLAPKKNNNKQATKSDYMDLIDQLQKSGTPISKFDQIPI